MYSEQTLSLCKQMEEHVIAAVQAAYSSGPQYDAAATQWLLEFQPSPQAWQVALPPPPPPRGGGGGEVRHNSLQ